MSVVFFYVLDTCHGRRTEKSVLRPGSIQCECSEDHHSGCISCNIHSHGAYLSLSGIGINSGVVFTTAAEYLVEAASPAIFMTADVATVAHIVAVV